MNNVLIILLQYVLQHFGETIDASVGCKMTCDYCINPKKVEREIQASECMSAVVNSHRLMHAGKERKNEGKKYHHNPMADDESLDDDYGDDFLGRDEGLLGITDCAREDEMPSEAMPKKASSVLSKYETLEVVGQRATNARSHMITKGGFVNFKTRAFDEPTQEDPDAKKHRAVSIPEHMRNGMPDPLAAHKKAANKTGLKSSKTYASLSERIMAELEEIEKQKAVALAAMGGRSLKSLFSMSSSKTLPTPSLSFKKRR